MTLIAQDNNTPNAWRKTTWHHEQAWASSQGAVLAVVSEARSRLIYLGAGDGSFNLLSAPVPAATPQSEKDSPNWGGHRFWLGPQKRWVWPPLTEWEHAAPASVRCEGGVLILTHQQSDASYPVITREYAWEGSKLRCTAKWKDDGRPYFGMHVVAVNTPFQVTATRRVWSELPEGIVDVQMDAPRASGLLPNPAIQVKSDKVTLTAGLRVVKAGFPPQTLETSRPGGWKIAVSPGPNEGVPITSPDFGYLSQVWVGESHVDLAELEQLTPYLLGDAKGDCASTIYISATAP